MGGGFAVPAVCRPGLGAAALALEYLLRVGFMPARFHFPIFIVLSHCCLRPFWLVPKWNEPYVFLLLFDVEGPIAIPAGPVFKFVIVHPLKPGCII
jgi:hypothetical protein